MGSCHLLRASLRRLVLEHPWVLRQWRRLEFASFPIVSLLWIAKGRRFHIPRIYSSAETLDFLMRNRVSMSRLGDGEMAIICGRDIGFQEYSPSLAKRLLEVLQTPALDHICCIPHPLVCRTGLTLKSQVFWRRHLLKMGAEWSRLSTQDHYYDTNVTRNYIERRRKFRSSESFDQFRSLWRDRNVVLVEGTESHVGEDNDLLDGVASLVAITGPATNAWRQYDELLLSCRQAAITDPTCLFLIALGPTATVLAFDLARTGTQALDIGHLDIEYEWFRRGCRRKSAVPNKAVNEVS